MISPDAGKIRQWLDALIHPDTEGWIHVARGIDGKFNAEGRYEFKKGYWRQAQFRSPGSRGEAVKWLAEHARDDDVYASPYATKTRQRAKGNTDGVRLVHSDVDVKFDIYDPAIDTGNGFVTASGSPDHGQVFIPLADEVTTEQHEALCRGLSKRLSGDSKISDNDVLRPAGTINHKGRARGGASTLVDFVREPQPNAKKIKARALAAELGVDLSNIAATNGSVTPKPVESSTPVTPEPVDLAAYPWLKDSLAEDTGDRSVDIYRVALDCYRAGLTEPQIRWVVNRRGDLVAKLGELKHDDIRRNLAKIADEWPNRQIREANIKAWLIAEILWKFKVPPMTAKATKGQRTIGWRTAAQVKDRKPEWAWSHGGKGRLMRSTLTLFAGRPDAGKSTAARFFAAGYTNGTIEGCFYGQPCDVAYIASEESLEVMVKPSLRAAGADMDRVHFPTVTMDGREVRLLSTVDEQALTAGLLAKGVRVVMVDPVMSAIGSNVDIHRNNETREYLEPWARIAEAINGLVNGIVHLIKIPGGDIVAAINGSSAFGEVPRAILAFAQDLQANDGTGVCSQEKNNAGTKDLALTYTIESATVTTDDQQLAEVGKFILGEPSERRVADLLRIDAATQQLGEQAYKVLDAVRQAGQPVDAGMVAALTYQSRRDVSQYLGRLAKYGLLKKVARGCYDVPR